MKMIEHNHFICHFIFGGHLLNIPKINNCGKSLLIPNKALPLHPQFGV